MKFNDTSFKIWKKIIKKAISDPSNQPLFVQPNKEKLKIIGLDRLYIKTLYLYIWVSFRSPQIYFLWPHSNRGDHDLKTSEDALTQVSVVLTNFWEIFLLIKCHQIFNHSLLPSLEKKGFRKLEYPYLGMICAKFY